MRLLYTGCVVLLGFLLHLPLAAYADSVTHIVRSGETLQGIARQHGVSMQALVSANRLENPDHLAIGRRLVIPGGRPQAPSVKSGTPARTQESEILPGFLWPVTGRVTSGYGPRTHPILKHFHFHKGIDIAASSGTPIVAAREGRVIFSGVKPQAGRVVILEHGDGFASVYAHTAENLVEVGDAVRAGQKIALVGRSGMTTGPHLYLEVWRDGRHMNPLLVLTNEATRVAELLDDGERSGGDGSASSSSHERQDWFEGAEPSSSLEVPVPPSMWR